MSRHGVSVHVLFEYGISKKRQTYLSVIVFVLLRSIHFVQINNSKSRYFYYRLLQSGQEPISQYKKLSKIIVDFLLLHEKDQVKVD